MGTDEIAYLLGYLELNSFLRAFTSWCGESPSEWRRRHA
jgi:AraC-like DNA-binding protein